MYFQSEAESESLALLIDFCTKITSTSFKFRLPCKTHKKDRVASLGTSAMLRVLKAINILILNNYLLDMLCEDVAGKWVSGTDTL